MVEKISSVLGPRGGRILTITELRAMGVSKPLSRSELGPRPTEDDLFCIMYTSGSTGPPKGVLLTNKNMIASRSCCLDSRDTPCADTDVVAGSTKLWAGIFQPGRDLLLAYLPLAHVLEQVSPAGMHGGHATHRLVVSRILVLPLRHAARIRDGQDTAQ